MILFPAIDLREGRVVRLYQGDFQKETDYNIKPEEQAKKFEDIGFEYLHVVDLDGAIVGAPFNKYVIQDIIKTVNIPIQVGGGIRSMEQIETWLQCEVHRVILGTVAVKDPDLVKQACKEFPDSIVIGMDARGENVAIEGWIKTSENTIYDMAKTFEDAGAAAILYTDIERDGTGQGPNIDSLKKLAQATSIPVIASGGVGSIDDIRALRDMEKDGIQGAIIGRALYENKIDPEKAVEIAQ